MKSSLAVLLLLFGSGAAICQQAGDLSGTPPVLVELFTSEGCSSCPPADAWLREVDASQPIRGAHVIALSEHVDYWDHDGWKDPYSLHSLTERQDAYSQELGLKTVYTPQLIVDGTRELHINDPRQMSEVFEKTALDAKISMKISAVDVEGSGPQIVHAHLDADGNLSAHNAGVYVAFALDHAESNVTSGENSGRRLDYVAVVENLEKVGTLKKGKSFSQDIQMKLKSGADPNNLRLVAFVQESGPGKVLGAAEAKIATGK